MKVSDREGSGWEGRGKSGREWGRARAALIEDSGNDAFVPHTIYPWSKQTHYEYLQFRIPLVTVKRGPCASVREISSAYKRKRIERSAFCGWASSGTVHTADITGM